MISSSMQTSKKTLVCIQFSSGSSLNQRRTSAQQWDFCYSTMLEGCVKEIILQQLKVIYILIINRYFIVQKIMLNMTFLEFINYVTYMQLI